MENFLSCDWGTTTFRLRLIETETLQIIEDESSRQGIAEIFKRWKQTNENDDKRLNFYLDIILSWIKVIEEKLKRSLDNVPLIISGMASSSIGMVDLPYRNLPFSAAGEDLEIFTTEATDDVKHQVVIVSGVRTDEDVMRGEETKLAGCNAADNYPGHFYIFPGTHPKHVKVKEGKATGFKTYMTGEFFDLLSVKSILAVSVKKGESLLSAKNLQSFSKGVGESKSSNILHSCFLVRTNDLFKKYSLEENYFYLSGLLIGNELKDIDSEKNITVVANAVLSAQYITALNVLGLPGKGASVETMNADEALIKGQKQVLKKVMRL